MLESDIQQTLFLPKHRCGSRLNDPIGTAFVDCEGLVVEGGFDNQKLESLSANAFGKQLEVRQLIGIAGWIEVCRDPP
jgi:hypothetical protein